MKKYLIGFLLGSTSVAFASTVNIDIAPRLAALKSIQAIVNTEIAYYTSLSTVVPPIVNPPPTPNPTPQPTAVTLVTNEYAHYNPTDPNAVKSTIFDMDSGSLFLQNGKYWTGIPDSIAPNAKSTNGNDSAIFRMTTKNTVYKNNTVSFDYTKNNLVTTANTPSQSWDGAHIFLHYLSEFTTDYISFDRRDGYIIAKKKCAGGPDNGGTYYDLTPATKYTFPSGTHHVVATENTNGTTVTMTLLVDGTKLLTAVDTGQGCSNNGTGAVGLRFDNNNATFSNFQVI